MCSLAVQVIGEAFSISKKETQQIEDDIEHFLINKFGKSSESMKAKFKSNGTFRRIGNTGDSELDKVLDIYSGKIPIESLEENQIEFLANIHADYLKDIPFTKLAVKRNYPLDIAYLRLLEAMSIGLPWLLSKYKQYVKSSKSYRHLNSVMWLIEHVVDTTKELNLPNELYNLKPISSIPGVSDLLEKNAKTLGKKISLLLKRSGYQNQDTGHFVHRDTVGDLEWGVYEGFVSDGNNSPLVINVYIQDAKDSTEDINISIRPDNVTRDTIHTDREVTNWYLEHYYGDSKSGSRRTVEVDDFITKKYLPLMKVIFKFLMKRYKLSKEELLKSFNFTSNDWSDYKKEIANI